MNKPNIVCALENNTHPIEVEIILATEGEIGKMCYFLRKNLKRM
jgi:hypothetical protein